MHVAWVNLTNGGISGGSRKYLLRVVPRFVDDGRITRLDMLSPAGIGDMPALDGLASHWHWHPAERWMGFPSVTQRLRRIAPDVLFIPTARWIEPSRAGLVVMVRNMEPLLKPNPENPAIERLVNVARRRAAQAACARADRIIAVSDFVAQHIHREWSVDPGKVSRIYHGVDEPIPDGDAVPPSALRNLSGDFLFLAGSLRPMRGIEDALRALASVGDTLPRLTLVVAGAPEGSVAGWLRGLHRVTESLGIADRVRWVGRLSQPEMAWCFRNSRMFLMTSRVEACPNTALEAMSHGTLIVSTTNSPMPEFFGDAAVYYPAGDHRRLAERIQQLFAMGPLERKRIQGAATSTAKSFSWDISADLTIRELERASNRASTVRGSKRAG